MDVVSKAVDHGQLYNIVKQASKELGIELKHNEDEHDEIKENDNEEYVLTVIADKGYYECESLKECLDFGINTIVLNKNHQI